MTVLFVIATIIIFLSIDWLVRRLRGQPFTAEQSALRSSPLRLPDGIFFAPSHTWLSLYPSGTVRIGVDDFISRLVDKPDVMLLKTPGDHIFKGEPMMQLKEGVHFLTIRSPLEGEILSVNEELTEHPSFLKERLFSDGWAYVMKPNKLNEIKSMLIGTETRLWARNEFRRLRDLFASSNDNGSLAPAYLQDGGPPIAGALRTMDDAVWLQLDRDFLQVQ